MQKTSKYCRPLPILIFFVLQYGQKMRMKSILLLLLVLMAGCTQYSVSTNAFADVQLIPQGFEKNASFAIVSSHRNDRLFTKEISHKIEKLLKEHGFVVKDQGKSDCLLVFDFDMKSFKEIVHVEKQVPGETVTKQGNTKTWGDQQLNKDYAEKVESSSKTIYVPEERTYFTGHLQIDVHKEDTPQKEVLWSVHTASTGSNNDLRELIDYLLVSSFNYFGQNTHKKVVKKFDKDCEEVKQLRNTL